MPGFHKFFSGQKFGSSSFQIQSDILFTTLLMSKIWKFAVNLHFSVRNSLKHQSRLAFFGIRTQNVLVQKCDTTFAHRKIYPMSLAQAMLSHNHCSCTSEAPFCRFQTSSSSLAMTLIIIDKYIKFFMYWNCSLKIIHANLIRFKNYLVAIVARGKISANNLI